MTGMIRVLLIEDHQLVREALCDTLSRQTGIEVVGQAGDAAGALEKATKLEPDVIVLDIQLPDVNGIELACRLRRAGTSARIVALSAYDDKRFVSEMLRAGAQAYVTKSAAGTELVRAIRSVHAGYSYFCPMISAILADGVRADGTDSPPALGRREREVLGLVAQGQRTSAIAEQLHISAATVEVHRRNIMRKLDLHTVAELTRYAVRKGLVSP